MEFVRLIQSNGGVLNGSTRFDFTNYFQVVPANAVETVLWAEADRMKGLAITQENLTNQQGVVKNEVKVNVLNQPYGGFPWLDMPQARQRELVQRAQLLRRPGGPRRRHAAGRAGRSSSQYYAPNNAVLVVSGDIDPSRRRWRWVQKYFGPIPRSPPPRRARHLRAAPGAGEAPVKAVPAAPPRPALAVG